MTEIVLCPKAIPKIETTYEGAFLFHNSLGRIPTDLSVGGMPFVTS